MLQNKDFRGGLQALINIVALAQTDGKRLRAYGFKSSLTDVLYTNEYMVHTWDLTYTQIGMPAPPPPLTTTATEDPISYVTEAYGNKKDRLVFVQGGVHMKPLNQALMKAGLALPTSTATDGHQFVGVVSTGSHGSDVMVGATQDFVKAIHLVIPGEHVLIQRATDLVVTEAYATYLGNARLISDDDMFNAALVSFGSFGLIHGMLFEAEPLYRLKMQSKTMNYKDVKGALSTMDVSSLGFDGVTTLPFHFEITVNTFRRNRRGCFVRIMEKEPLSEAELSRLRKPADAYFDDSDAAQIASFQQNAVETDMYTAFEKAVTPFMGLSKLPKKLLYGLGFQVVLVNFFDTRRRKPVTKYPAEFFQAFNGAASFTQYPVGGTGMEIGVPVERAGEVVDLIIEIMEQDPIAAPIAVRYVKATAATLGFTKYNITATIELPGPYGRVLFRNTHTVHQMIFDALVERNIPHTFHWGQHFPNHQEWVARSYGTDALESFRTQRDTLLGTVGREMFANDIMEKIGIYVR